MGDDPVTRIVQDPRCRGQPITWAEERQRQIEANEPLVALLRSWRENVDEDEAREQRETWEFLKRALDEDRLSDRKLFP